MFEGALDPEKRHDLGAHYTSEQNILKVIDSLFLDDLRDEFEQIKKRQRGKKSKLEEFHQKLSALKFLDPASGSGNFLIVAYRELRRLEHEVLQAIVEDDKEQGFQTDLLFIQENIKVEVAQFYGIEIVPYAVSIARVGLWLMDHLMNVEASKLFGLYFARLPLHAGANITAADSLTVDWDEIVPATELNYILGNPPFLGARNLDDVQRANLHEVIRVLPKKSQTDFVAGWYVKAAHYMAANDKIQAALVSTNSITQGEQATNIWKYLFNLGISINFAHQTFKWDNNGAAVYVVIIGFSLQKKRVKVLFSYETPDAAPVKHVVKNINQYLLDAPAEFIEGRRKAISDLPMMMKGSPFYDGGNLVITKAERETLIKAIPELEPYILKIITAKVHLHPDVEADYALYLKNAPITLYSKNRFIMDRLDAVTEFRKKSSQKDVREKQNMPTILGADRYRASNFLLVPVVSSENREYLPVGYYPKENIASNAVFQVLDGDDVTFGLLSSKMHMAWLQMISGKLEGRIRYSNTMVYNTFFVPDIADDKKTEISNVVKEILRLRDEFVLRGDGLADLYNSQLMPAELRKQHQKLDRIVESLYSSDQIESDEERVAILLKLYQRAIKRETKKKD